MCYILEYVSWVVASARWTICPIYVHDLLKKVGNSVSNVKIAFISSDLLRSSLFGITCFWLIPVFDFGL